MRDTSITASGRNRRAYFLGKLPDGRRVHRYTVRVELCNPSSRLFDTDEFEVSMVSDSPANAAFAVQEDVLEVMHANDAFHITATITTWGPKGGRYERFISTESAIGAFMFGARRASESLPLKL